MKIDKDYLLLRRNFNQPVVIVITMLLGLWFPIYNVWIFLTIPFRWVKEKLFIK